MVYRLNIYHIYKNIVHWLMLHLYDCDQIVFFCDQVEKRKNFIDDSLKIKFRDFLLFFFQDEIMAQRVIPQSSIDSLSPSQSSASFQSRRSYGSRQSLDTLSSSRSGRRYGLFSKLGDGFQLLFRRFSRKYKSLSQLEIQILSTITNYDREQILEW